MNKRFPETKPTKNDAIEYLMKQHQIKKLWILINFPTIESFIAIVKN